VTPGPMTAEDRLAVMDLMATYSRCLDIGDEDGWFGIFRPDAVLESSRGTASGEAELRAWYRRLVGEGIVGSDPAQLVHFIGLPLISGDSEQCSVQTYTIIIDFDDAKEIRMPLIGLYDDRCVHVDGRWWIAHRVINNLLTAASRTRP
jgi:hypothetical protein